MCSRILGETAADAREGKPNELGSSSDEGEEGLFKVDPISFAGCVVFSISGARNHRDSHVAPRPQKLF